MSRTDCCVKCCLSNFDDDFRSRLKESLAKESKTHRQLYLFGMVSVNETKLCRPGAVKASSKLFQYRVRKNGEMLPVCKSAFMYLHDVTETALRTLCSKMLDERTLIPTDNRGRHQNHYLIPETTRELIEFHLYATLESPNVFKCSKIKLGEPNIKQLWVDFNQKYGNSGHRVSRMTYSKYVNTLLTPDVKLQFKTASAGYELFQKSQNSTRKKFD